MHPLATLPTCALARCGCIQFNSGLGGRATEGAARFDLYAFNTHRVGARSQLMHRYGVLAMNEPRRVGYFEASMERRVRRPVKRYSLLLQSRLTAIPAEIGVRRSRRRWPT